MDIEQEIKRVQYELEGAVANANELAERAQGLLWQRRNVLQEVRRLEGELRVLKRLTDQKTDEVK